MTKPPREISKLYLPKTVIILDEESWRDKAACKDEPWELFYPDAPPEQDENPNWMKNPPGEQIIEEREKKALSICYSCPVRPECLEDSVTNISHDRYGIRGGLTAKQRAHYAGRRWDSAVGIHRSGEKQRILYGHDNHGIKKKEVKHETFDESSQDAVPA